MLKLLTPYQAFGQSQLLVDIGSADARFEGDHNVTRVKPTNLGMLVGQAMLEKTHADFTVVNAGGLRESLPAGRITFKDVLKVQPFGNTLVTVKLTGAEVLDSLRVAAAMSPGAGGFPHLRGIKLVRSGGAVTQARIQGAALDPSKTYQMVINSFMAVGGDGYPKLTGHPGYVNTGFVDAEVLREYIAANSPLQSAHFEPGP